MTQHDPVDVVVVGAGAIGAATAYYLSVADPKLKIALVEQDHVGMGSTARSFAAYRKQFRSKIHIRASVLSQREYERFPELTGGHECGLRQIGYLFLYSNPEELENAAVAVKRQQELGVPDATVLTASQLRDKFPFCDGPLAGATWCPSDGYIDPLAVAMGFAAGAKDRGVRVLQTTRVTSLEVSNKRVQGVRLGTSGDLLKASKVVLATGAWAKRLAPLVPLAPVKRYVYTSPAIKGRDVTSFPMTILDLGPYIRTEARHSLAWACDERPAEPEPGEIPSLPGLPDEPDYDIGPGFGAGADEYGFEILLKLSAGMSFLLEEEIGIAASLCGYYETTPDHRVVIDDRYPDVAGLVVAAGASGHGMMHAPAYGMLATDLVLDRPMRIEGARESFALGPLLEGEKRPDPETMII